MTTLYILKTENIGIPNSSSSSKMLWGSPLGLDSEYITIMVMNMPRSGSEYARFWICQGSEYVRVTQGKAMNMSDYVWLNMPGYIWICWHMNEYAYFCHNSLCFVFPHCNLLVVLEGVITYFNIYTKLEVLVWMKMRLFSLRDPIWFSSCS